MNKRVINRLPQLMIGLFLCGMGLGFTIEANLGLNPWDVFHDGFSKLINVKIGQASVITGFIVLLGWIPLKQKPFIGTILNILTIGNVTDLTMHYIQSPDDLIIKIAYLVFGTMCFGIGIGIYVGSGLGPGPRDGLMTGLQKKTNLPIAFVRAFLEISVVTIGWYLGGTVGVGTILFAFGIGPCVAFGLYIVDKISTKR